MTPRKRIFCTHSNCRLRVHVARAKRGLTTCTACASQIKSRRIMAENRLVGSIAGEYIARALGFL